MSRCQQPASRTLVMAEIVSNLINDKSRVTHTDLEANTELCLLNLLLIIDQDLRLSKMYGTGCHVDWQKLRRTIGSRNVVNLSLT